MSDKLPSYLEQLLALCYVCCLFIMVGFYSGTVKYCQVIWLGIHGTMWWVASHTAFKHQTTKRVWSETFNFTFLQFCPSILQQPPLHTLTSPHKLTPVIQPPTVAGRLQYSVPFPWSCVTIWEVYLCEFLWHDMMINYARG